MGITTGRVVCFDAQQTGIFTLQVTVMIVIKWGWLYLNRIELNWIVWCSGELNWRKRGTGSGAGVATRTIQYMDVQSNREVWKNKNIWFHLSSTVWLCWNGSKSCDLCKISVQTVNHLLVASSLISRCKGVHVTCLRPCYWLHLYCSVQLHSATAWKVCIHKLVDKIQENREMMYGKVWKEEQKYGVKEIWC